MEFRPIQLPRDLHPIGDMICDAFQYPENPEWGVQVDEKDQIANSIRTIRKLWPLIKVMGTVSPPMRDIFRGYVAVDSGNIAGLTLLQRRGTTDTWIVGTVGVLPEHRRKGIARTTLEKSIDYMRTRGAKRTWLGVIDGNVPAQSLYQSLGFKTYDASTDYTLLQSSRVQTPKIPDGYTLERLAQFDWKTRYELELRIAPLETRQYEPIERGRYRQPLLMRALLPLLMRLQRVKDKEYIVRAPSGEIVGRCGYSASMRGKGVNNVYARLSPEHPEVAAYIVGYVLNKVVSLSPNLRVEIGIPGWMPAVAEAAESYGFTKRVTYLKMGLSLE